jgi:hypothetical protein
MDLDRGDVTSGALSFSLSLSFSLFSSLQLEGRIAADRWIVQCTAPYVCEWVEEFGRSDVRTQQAAVGEGLGLVDTQAFPTLG